MDAVARLAVLEKLASQFPGENAIDLTLYWENDHCSAGVVSQPKAAFVYLQNAQQSVESLSEAAELLKAIFADEIVAVTAFAQGAPVYQGLGRASDPTAGFNQLDGPGGLNMPSIDEVTIESWSRGLHEED